MMKTQIVHEYPNGNVDVVIGPVDIPLLKEQIEILIEMIWDEPDNITWGIVEMLNDVVDLRE